MPRLRIAAVIVLGAVVAGCSSQGDSEEAPTATAAATTSTAFPTTSTAPNTSLTAAEIYAQVAPSLALVETPLSTGSGILFTDGLLVTNAHVVWPYDRVDVRFGAGASGRDLPVVAVDPAADLALVDVTAIDRTPDAIAIRSVDPMPGSTVYLIGFPSDDPSDPEAAITTGIISRSRSWAAAGLSFIQSDALISGGQSGGALVDDGGAVIGITSLEIGEGFALAVAGTDVLERIDRLRSGEDPSGVGERGIDHLITDETSVVLAHAVEEAVWVFDPEPGETVVIDVKAQAPVSGSIIAPDGYLEATLEGGVVSFVPTLDGPHFLSLVPEAGFETRVEVAADLDLRRLTDPDHGRVLRVGETRLGNIDYPGDVDWFTLEVGAGDTIVLTASSTNADMAIRVAPLDNLNGNEARSDSDSGGGVIGSDAEVRYTAIEASTLIVAVFDETQFGPGAYAVTVETP